VPSNTDESPCGIWYWRFLPQISSTTISDFSSIGYDAVGNRNSVTASIPGATSLNGTTGYTYDTKDQITQETSTRNRGFTDNFAYDSAGNPTSFKGVTKNYNSNNQQTEPLESSSTTGTIPS